MKGRVLLITGFMMVIAACRPAAPPESPETLSANPTRLNAIIRACRDREPHVTPSLCSAAAEAARRRFMEERTPYTPETIVITARRPR